MIVENFIYFISRICCFTNYINNVQGFPKPLTNKEEQDYFDKMKEGDSNAREKLINHNLRLVAHIVKKYANSLEADDLISVGIIGLIKAIDSFDYSKGVQLSTYAARCIDNEILMLIRANKKHKNVVSLNNLYSTDNEENDLELMDILAAEDEEVFEQVENNIMMEKLKILIDRNLSGREKDIIELRYGLGKNKPMTQKDVAKLLGISRSYISRIESKAIDIIKKDVDNI
ncbi:MAG: RNA polymerase sporulation sigma factor SigK [Clostridia bacterium]|nr:RNA polymerase sporulation sigma factor SigK [Clostridia bacterium]